MAALIPALIKLLMSRARRGGGGGGKGGGMPAAPMSDREKDNKYWSDRRFDAPDIPNYGAMTKGLPQVKTWQQVQDEANGR